MSTRHIKVLTMMLVIKTLQAADVPSKNMAPLITISGQQLTIESQFRIQGAQLNEAHLNRDGLEDSEKSLTQQVAQWLENACETMLDCCFGTSE